MRPTVQLFLWPPSGSHFPSPRARVPHPPLGRRLELHHGPVSATRGISVPGAARHQAHPVASVPEASGVSPAPSRIQRHSHGHGHGHEATAAPLWGRTDTRAGGGWHQCAPHTPEAHAAGRWGPRRFPSHPEGRRVAGRVTGPIPSHVTGPSGTHCSSERGDVLWYRESQDKKYKGSVISGPSSVAVTPAPRVSVNSDVHVSHGHTFLFVQPTAWLRAAKRFETTGLTLRLSGWGWGSVSPSDPP